MRKTSKRDAFATKIWLLASVLFSSLLFGGCTSVSSVRQQSQIQAEFDKAVAPASASYVHGVHLAYQQMRTGIHKDLDLLNSEFVEKCISEDDWANRLKDKSGDSASSELETYLRIRAKRIVALRVGVFRESERYELETLCKKLLLASVPTNLLILRLEDWNKTVQDFNPQVDVSEIRGGSFLKAVIDGTPVVSTPLCLNPETSPIGLGLDAISFGADLLRSHYVKKRAKQSAQANLEGLMKIENSSIPLLDYHAIEQICRRSFDPRMALDILQCE